VHFLATYAVDHAIKLLQNLIVTGRYTSKTLKYIDFQFANQDYCKSLIFINLFWPSLTGTETTYQAKNAHVPAE